MNHRVTEPQRRWEDTDSRRERKSHSAAGPQSKRQEQPRNTPNTRKQAGKQFPVPFRVFSVFRGSRRSSSLLASPAPKDLSERLLENCCQKSNTFQDSSAMAGILTA